MIKVLSDDIKITNNLPSNSSIKFYQRFHYKYQKYLLASYKSLTARRLLRSHSLIENEKRKHLGIYEYTIHPYSLFRLFLMILYILY